MAMIYDYEFKSKEYQDNWESILNNRFESMELHYRKQFTMPRLLSYFKIAFEITPITLKKNTDDNLYRYKLLAIYLLTKYSNEDFEVIAKEFNISLITMNLIDGNNTYGLVFQNEIKLFFKQFEEDYLIEKKESLALKESSSQILLDNIIEDS